MPDVVSPRKKKVFFFTREGMREAEATCISSTNSQRYCSQHRNDISSEQGIQGCETRAGEPSGEGKRKPCNQISGR